MSSTVKNQAMQSPNATALLELTTARTRQGFAPPPEVYRVENRSRIDWSQLPDWARPVDPECFEGCCHEG